MKRILIAVLLLIFTTAGAQQKIWEGTSCRVKHATLTAYMPQATPRAAIIICPGGSYHWLDKDAEGSRVAEWLASEGYAAYVLKYRVAGKVEYVAKYRTVFRGNRHPDMICDLQRAIQLVKQQYDGPVGVMGFSAGGHLATMSGEFFDSNFLKRYDIVPEVSLRPDFVAAIYPVVTLSDERYVHKRSRLGVLGERSVKKQTLRDSLSTEKHVRADMPPVFLLNCVDDPIVDYHNSMLLDSALRHHHVPHSYVQFATGGHGFGADPEKMNEETLTWQKQFIDWMRSMSF